MLFGWRAIGEDEYKFRRQSMHKEKITRYKSDNIVDIGNFL